VKKVVVDETCGIAHGGISGTEEGQTNVLGTFRTLT
jgi:hypothetical protein